MLLEETTQIDAPPEEVFRFFEDIEHQYEPWHPGHQEFRWVKGDGLAPGNEAYFAEVIDGDRKEFTVRYTTVDPPRRIELRPTSRLLRLLLPRITFTIDPHDTGSQVTQRIRIRTGPLGARLNRREFDALRTHMAEEGDNLKHIIESHP